LRHALRKHYFAPSTTTVCMEGVFADDD
jgi:hypothetical protein